MCGYRYWQVTPPEGDGQTAQRKTWRRWCTCHCFDRTRWLQHLWIYCTPMQFLSSWLHSFIHSFIHSPIKFLFKLHSFAGVGLGEQSQDVLLGKVFHNKKAKDRWITTKVLIVDEVVSLTFLFYITPLHLIFCVSQSMLEGTFFDKLEYIARKVRKSDAPFGGIQLILSGDFLQVGMASFFSPKTCQQQNSFVFDLFLLYGCPPLASSSANKNVLL